ncbi:MAG: helix-turn-helix domain-containing protein [Pseudoxanthomonas sp.]
MLLASTDSNLNRSQVAILGAVLNRMQGKDEAWPSLSTIADDAKVSRSQVVRGLPVLIEHGYLDRSSGDRTTSNRYVLGRLGRRTDASTCRCTDASTCRCTDASTCRCTDAPRVGANLHLGVGAPMHLEAVKAKAINTRETGKAIPSASAGDRFTEFWSVYPRRESKPQAEKSWRRQKLDSKADMILTDLQARLADPGQWQKTERRFIPLPATYLNGRRWEDDWQASLPTGVLPRDTRSEDEIAAQLEAQVAQRWGGAA